MQAPFRVLEPRAGWQERAALRQGAKAFWENIVLSVHLIFPAQSFMDQYTLLLNSTPISTSIKHGVNSGVTNRPDKKRPIFEFEF